MQLMIGRSVCAYMEPDNVGENKRMMIRNADGQLDPKPKTPTTIRSREKDKQGRYQYVMKQ